MSRLNKALSELHTQLTAITLDSDSLSQLTEVQFSWLESLSDTLNWLTITLNAQPEHHKLLCFEKMFRRARKASFSLGPAREIPEPKSVLQPVVYALQTLDSYPRLPNADAFDSFLQEVDEFTLELCELAELAVTSLIIGSPSYGS